MLFKRRPVAIVPRRLSWDFSTSTKYWFKGSPLLTHLLNVYTLLVPDNEKYYIRTLSARLDEVNDASLRADLLRFFQQESLHGLAHKKYWPHIGVAQKTIARIVDASNFLLYRVMEPLQPKALRMSIVAAIEHINATWAHIFLEHDGLANADPEVQRLFYWHFAEEIEHKSVAHDALTALHPGYFTRIAGCLVAVPIFYLLIAAWTVYLLACDGRLWRRENLSDLKYLVFETSFVSRGFSEVVRYLRRDFSPWDVDDLELANQVLHRDAVPGGAATSNIAAAAGGEAQGGAALPRVSRLRSRG